MVMVKKLNAVFAVTLIVLLFVTSITGCQQKPETAPAKFELKSLYIEPEETVLGETVSITAVVENIGGSEGTYAAILTVDGVPVEAKEVAITAGSSKTITFSLVKDTPGIYEIGVEGLKSTLIVKEESEPVVENIEIKYDDGISEGAWALGGAGQGHVVHFLPPVIPFTIDAIKIYGNLYGTGYEKLSAEIEVWNEDFDVLYNCQVPHTIFGLQPGWVTIETPGVVVDGDFYVFVFTNSPAEGGVSIYYDSSVRNTHSEVTLYRRIAEWYLETPKSEVNWMIRVEQASLPATGGEESSAENSTEKKSGTAKIEISFSPNPVPLEGGRYLWKVILTEVNGIGVYLIEITHEEYIHDNLYGSHQLDERSLKDEFPPDAYLSAFGSLDFGAGFDYGSVTRQFTHWIFIVVGVDDNGNEVRAEGKVDFIQ